MTTNEKIALLRKAMEREQVDAAVIPSSDPHLSEYVPDYYTARAYLSGFTGSAGTLVVTKEGSYLWADGRYYIQAERQIAGSEIQLMKLGMPDVPGVTKWLSEELGEGQTVGIDGRLFSVKFKEDLEKAFERKKLKLSIGHDFVSQVWTEGRPAMPGEPAFLHDVKYTGLTAAEKLAKVREKMDKEGAQCYLISALDSIAWLLNIRGWDIECNPVVISFVLLTPDKTYFFVDEKKVVGAVGEALAKAGVTVLPYEQVYETLGTVQGSIAFDAGRTNCALEAAIPQGVKRMPMADIAYTLKAEKNDTEVACMREANLKDDTAVTKFLYWIDQNVGKMPITEYDVGDKLIELRKEQEGYLGEGFGVIAAYRANAAMMHYSASKDNCAEIKPEGMLLVDTGGQYYEGTTDITRTMVLGPITEEEKHDFTYVLKSAIGLMSAKFLSDTYSGSLDVLARQPLWDVGLDYKCGTGHGVGFCLNVHEGPQGFYRSAMGVIMKPGMVTTVEPGVYKEDKFGIRTENTVVCVKDEETPYGGQFCKFEMISFCPIDRRAIDPALLSDKELEFLNNYHAQVLEKIGPRLNPEERAWLAEMCKPMVK